MVRRLLPFVIAAALVHGACNCGGNTCNSPEDCPGQTCSNGICVPIGGGDGGGGDGGGGGGSDGGRDGGVDGGGGGGGGDAGCVNLQCQQVPCADGGTTRITGTVYDPGGNVPLYNAIVYVPNGPIQPFTPGVSCDRCGAVTSGDPVTLTVTGPDGRFALDNMPAGSSIPLVIQIGRWRRQVTIPTVPACNSTSITDVDLLRLPRNKLEGDIPLMAIATGDADPFECLLRKIGIDDSEFTHPTGDGRVHYYRQNGKNTNPSAPAASTLWSDLDTLRQYDVVMLPCEGRDNPKSSGATQNIIDYTSAGGRMFATHFSYVWIARAQDPFPSTGDWDLNQSHPRDPNPWRYYIDTSFPKGQAFSDWLVNVGASTTAGELVIVESRYDINAVNNPPAQRWIYGNKDGGTLNPDTIQHLTFNTPIDAGIPPGETEPLQCGRVVFSDFHVSADALSGSTYFPASCNNDPLTAQEKALEFMLFDLSSCVRADTPVTCPGETEACTPLDPCCAGLSCLNPQSMPCTSMTGCTCGVPIGRAPRPGDEAR